MVQRKRFSIAQGLIYLLLTCISLLCILPMLLVVAVSFTDKAVSADTDTAIPKNCRWPLTRSCFIRALRSMQAAG